MCTFKYCARFSVFFLSVRGLFKCKEFFLRTAILQDSCKTNGYLVRFWQNEWLSCKILANRRAILQYSCKKLLSCKILQDSGRNSWKTMYRLARFCQILAKSCKITIRIQLGCTKKQASLKGPLISEELLQPSCLNKTNRKFYFVFSNNVIRIKVQDLFVQSMSCLLRNMYGSLYLVNIFFATLQHFLLNTL